MNTIDEQQAKTLLRETVLDLAGRGFDPCMADDIVEGFFYALKELGNGQGDTVQINLVGAN